MAKVRIYKLEGEKQDYVPMGDDPYAFEILKDEEFKYLYIDDKDIDFFCCIKATGDQAMDEKMLYESMCATFDIYWKNYVEASDVGMPDNALSVRKKLKQHFCSVPK